MDLNDIPEGVSEVSFDNLCEALAFIRGLQYANDIDVCNSEPFFRGNQYVVRVRVGDFD
jgi:hypothetical protein